MNFRLYNMHWLVAVIVSVMVAACASQRTPQGGPKDETPPVLLRTNPSMGAKNVESQRLDLYFDENVQVKDVMTKVVVSPAQIQTPVITANGRRLTVELRDTLKSNTTYTIDFSDAVSDLNEGNIYDGLAMEFSTGDTIDTLRISGMLFEARNLEPAQGMLVGVYSNLDDSALTTLPMDRIARTNQFGQFTIRGLKEGRYRVFAINDVNRDYKWDRSEDIAFYDMVVSPSVREIMVSDTLLSSEDTDSIVTRSGVEYLPNDLLLTWFNEGYKAQYLNKYERPDSMKIRIEMAAASDSLPVLKIVNGVNAGRYIDNSVSRLNASLTLDTLEYWITDPSIIAQDSLRIETRYMKTDTADNLTWTVDTLYFNYKRPKVKENKKKKKEEILADSLKAAEAMLINLTFGSGSSQDVYRPYMMKSTTPVDSIDYSKIHFEIKEDSLWKPVKLNPFRPDTLYNSLTFKTDYEWVPEAQYRLRVDTMAVFDVYGRHNRPIVSEIKVKSLEDYTKLYVDIPDEGNYIVEVLDKSDKPVATAPVIDGLAAFEYLEPGSYYLRAYHDRNGNGKWDTGNVNEKIQPEEVYYNPKQFNLRKFWDSTENWSLNDIAIDMQKPQEIKKNKPKLKGEEEKKSEEELQDEEDWNTNFIPGSQYNDIHRNQRNRF